MKRDLKLYAMLRGSSNLLHSFDYARFYRKEDEHWKEDSHSGKCKIISKLSASFHDAPSVLDVGCGTGRYFHCLTNLGFLVGVDPSENMLKMARNPVNCGARDAQLVQGSLHEIEFRPESFDLIICVGVFGVVCPLDEFSLARIANFLKPNGIFFFTVPEYVPTIDTWKRKLARVAEPFLFGQLKRYVKVRLKRFATSETQVRRLLLPRFKEVEISRWRSGTGRMDLHCIVGKNSTRISKTAATGLRRN